MSTRRGNTKKQGQKHQNVTAFKDYKGCTIYKKIKALPNEGLCEKCHDIIEWKKKYHKYKPLTSPGVCLICKKKTIRHAYHTVCQECATANEMCAKCREKKRIVNDFKENKVEKETEEEIKLQDQIEMLSLRQKKSFYRQLEKNPEADQQELLNQFKIREKDDDWDDFSDDDFDDDDDFEDDMKEKKMEKNEKKEDNEESDEDDDSDFDDSDED